MCLLVWIALAILKTPVSFWTCEDSYDLTKSTPNSGKWESFPVCKKPMTLVSLWNADRLKNLLRSPNYEEAEKNGNRDVVFFPSPKTAKKKLLTLLWVDVLCQAISCSLGGYRVWTHTVGAGDKVAPSDHDSGMDTSPLCFVSVFLNRDLKFSLLFTNTKSCRHILLISAVSSAHTEMWVTHQHKCCRGWQVEFLDEHLQKKYLGLFKDHINSTNWGR